MSLRVKNRKNQKGYTLLEYCAGAAIISAIIFVALQALGGNMRGLLESIGSWADRRAAEIDQQ